METEIEQIDKIHLKKVLTKVSELQDLEGKSSEMPSTNKNQYFDEDDDDGFTNFENSTPLNVREESPEEIRNELKALLQTKL